jgi:small subunit ribosomal protein S1
MRRPADDEFWARLRWCVDAGQAALLEENPVGNLTRWHQLTPGTLDAVRAGLGPRALLTVWPDLPWDDVATILAALPMRRQSSWYSRMLASGSGAPTPTRNGG